METYEDGNVDSALTPQSNSTQMRRSSRKNATTITPDEYKLTTMADAKEREKSHPIIHPLMSSENEIQSFVSSENEIQSFVSSESEMNEEMSTLMVIQDIEQSLSHKSDISKRSWCKETKNRYPVFRSKKTRQNRKKSPRTCSLSEIELLSMIMSIPRKRSQCEEVRLQRQLAWSANELLCDSNSPSYEEIARKRSLPPQCSRSLLDELELPQSESSPGIAKIQASLCKVSTIGTWDEEILSASNTHPGKPSKNENLGENSCGEQKDNVIITEVKNEKQTELNVKSTEQPVCIYVAQSMPIPPSEIHAETISNIERKPHEIQEFTQRLELATIHHHRRSSAYPTSLQTKEDNISLSRKFSLPTHEKINSDDLSRLSGVQEKAKGRKISESTFSLPFSLHRKSVKNVSAAVEPSFFNRLTRKLTHSDSNDMCNNSNKKEASTEPIDKQQTRSRSPSPCRINIKDTLPVMNGPNLSSPSNKRKTTLINSRKFFERKILAQNDKGKSSGVGRKIARKFSNISDNLLQHAVIHKDLDMLEKLLPEENYVNEINYLEPPGVNILHQACVFGDLKIIKLLLRKGAKVNLKTWARLSPLKIAVMYGHYEVAQFLLLTGADLNEIKDGFQHEEN